MEDGCSLGMCDKYEQEKNVPQKLVHFGFSLYIYIFWVIKEWAKSHHGVSKLNIFFRLCIYLVHNL